MSERLTREAPLDVCEKVRQAFKKRYAEKDFWEEPFWSDVEDILGPYDKKNVGDFGVQFTKLQAEPDGFHECVTLYF